MPLHYPRTKVIRHGYSLGMTWWCDKFSERITRIQTAENIGTQITATKKFKA